MEDYLLANHKGDIIDIINNSDDSSGPSVAVNLTHLHHHNPELFTDVVNDIHNESLKWSTVLLDLQKRFAETDEFLDPDWLIKENCRVRFDNLPEHDLRNRLTFPTGDDIGKLVQIKGTVLRATQPKFLEYRTDYLCGHCKATITIEGEYGKYYVAAPPSRCPNGCKGKPYGSDTTNVVNENFVTYQEIKIMEALSKKSTPSVMEVTLDDDLVESCQPGDSVTICGTVESRYIFGHKMEIKVVIRANSVSNQMKQVNIGNELPEHLICLRAEWNEFIEKYGELGARDLIVQSICPDVHGMYIAKLAVALAICSGYDSSSAVSGLRNHSHVLLIGDPGLAKSRLLKFATAVSTRCSFVTGSGISSAGLTAAAFQEAGEWQLEAGALPLADNGICCIDEFNMMSESDKASLHEAMEQQTIHISKAGIACKLNTRCSIVAATNPKNLYSMSDHEGTSAINLGLASSLVSRFDLVLILRDERNKEWDTRVANHIFYEAGPTLSESLYDLVKLQAHFSAVRDIDPILTDGAIRILKAYYLACRADEERDAGRTTLRFNDSLYRLAKAHAKLLFRYEVTEIDACLVVMLMESSFGFGRILQSKNILHEDLPLGPSDDQIIDLLDRLNIERIHPPDNGQLENGISNGHTLHSTSLTQGLQVGAKHASNKANETTDRRSENVHITRTTTLNSTNENVHGFNAKKFPSKKRQLDCSSSNENVSLVSVHETRSPKTQPSNRSVLLEMQPTISHWKRFRTNSDDEDLDTLFTLDEPIAKSKEKDALIRVVPASVPVPVLRNPSKDEFDKLFTLDEPIAKSKEKDALNRVVPASVPVPVPVLRNPSKDEFDKLFTLDEPIAKSKEKDALNRVVPASGPVPVLRNPSKDEFDKLFTLNEPIMKSTEVNVVDINVVPGRVPFLGNPSNDEEFNELFTLDEPMAKSVEANVVDDVTNNVNVPSSVLENPSGTEQSERVEQPTRFRIFNHCTDDDLAAFDDLDF